MAIPDPRNYTRLTDWANDLYKHMQAQEELMPKPHFFSALQTVDKATENGIVQFDHVAERLVVSLNGVWEPIPITSDI